jgi:hypothetical protein
VDGIAKDGRVPPLGSRLCSQILPKEAMPRMAAKVGIPLLLVVLSYFEHEALAQLGSLSFIGLIPSLDRNRAFRHWSRNASVLIG